MLFVTIIPKIRKKKMWTILISENTLPHVASCAYSWILNKVITHVFRMGLVTKYLHFILLIIFKRWIINLAQHQRETECIEHMLCFISDQIKDESKVDFLFLFHDVALPFFFFFFELTTMLTVTLSIIVTIYLSKKKCTYTNVKNG